MKITTSHSMIKPMLRFFLFYHGVCSNILNMIPSAILLLYDFVGIYYRWLTSIPTVNKDLNETNKNK